MAKPPSRILLEDFMIPLGLTANKLAKGLWLNRSTIGRLVAGTQRITPSMAARLGAFFNVPARWWLLMQAEYDAYDLERHPQALGITPLDLDPAILLTPSGVLRMDDPPHRGLADTPPLSISIQELSADNASLGGNAESTPRAVRTVRYENGSVALVGDHF